MSRGILNVGGRLVARFILAAGLTMAMLGASCAGQGKQKILIPEADTAREQFAVADHQEHEARGVYDQKVRSQEMVKTIAAYRKLEERFPNDSKYTPAASLLVANIQRDLKQYENALAQYEMCLKKYSNDDAVRVSALMGLGQTYDDLKQPQRAQPYYKTITDEYAKASDPKMKEMVEQARLRYRQIRLIGD